MDRTPTAVALAAPAADSSFLYAKTDSRPAVLPHAAEKPATAESAAHRVRAFVAPSSTDNTTGTSPVHQDFYQGRPEDRDSDLPYRDNRAPAPIDSAATRAVADGT